MKKHTFLTLVLTSQVCLNCTQQKSKEEDKAELPKGKIDFVAVESPSPDTTNVSTGDTSRVIQKGGNGYAAKYWHRILKNCMSSDLLRSSELDYLGPSNTIGLGSIIDVHRNVFRTVDNNVFNDAELKSIIRTGAPTSCEYDRDTKLKLTSLLSGNITLAGDAKASVSLGALVNNSSKIVFKVKSWQKDDLLLGELMDALASNVTAKKKTFLNDLLAADKMVMSRVVRVNGFEADVDLNSDITPELKAKLNNPISPKIAFDSIKVSVNVVNNRKLSIKSDGVMYIYGKYYKYATSERNGVAAR